MARADAACAGGAFSSALAEKGFKVEIASSVDAEEVIDSGSGVDARADRMYESGSISGLGERLLVLTKKRGRAEMAAGCLTTAKERISRMPPCVAGKRSSIYRGVTRHRWTGRYEAHLWDKSTWNQNQNKKGKQVYLGAYDDEEAAARAYDLAALKYWGAGTLINFPVSDYSRDLEEMQLVSKEEYLASLRRKSSAFSKGFPKCRAIPRAPQNSQWETPLAQVFGLNRDIKTKIDLTHLIRWWGPNKVHQLDTSDRYYSETDILSNNLETELHALESSLQCTEPYQLPYLGRPDKRMSHGSSPITASGILAQSSSFKNLKKFLESQDCSDEITVNNCQPMAVQSLAVGAVGLGAGLGFYGGNLIDQVPDLLQWEKLPLQEKNKGACGGDRLVP